MSQTGLLPLLTSQVDTWEEFKENPQSVLNNTAERIELRGPLDIQRFTQAIQLMLEDVPALHTRFIDEGTAPRQDLGPDGKGAVKPHDLIVIDLQKEEDPFSVANTHIQKQLAQPFNLTSGALYHNTLYQLAPDLHWWIFSSHHIALDGYGVMLCLQRVATIYKYHGQQGASEEYFDAFTTVIEQDQQYQKSEQPIADQQFFKAQFSDIPYEKPPHLELGLSRGCCLDQALPIQLFQQLQQTALDHSVAWPHFLFGLVASYWHYQFKDPTIFLGVPVMRRLGSVAAKVPCMVMNTVPLRIDVRPQDSLLALGQQARQAFAALQAHQSYRYERIWEDTNHHRIFGPEVNVIPYIAPLDFGEDLEVDLRNVANGALESLAFAFKVWNDQLHLQVCGHPKLYTPEQIAAIHQNLQRVLEVALKHPTEALEPLWQTHANLGTA